MGLEEGDGGPEGTLRGVWGEVGVSGTPGGGIGVQPVGYRGSMGLGGGRWGSQKNMGSQKGA